MGGGCGCGWFAAGYVTMGGCGSRGVRIFGGHTKYTYTRLVRLCCAHTPTSTWSAVRTWFSARCSRGDPLPSHKVP